MLSAFVHGENWGRAARASAWIRLVGMVVLATAWTLSCGGDSRPSMGGAAPAARPTVPASVDLQAVVRRAHFAFASTGAGAFSGGHDTYAVEADAQGFSVVPRSSRRFEGAHLSLRTERLGRSGDAVTTGQAPELEPDGALSVRRGESTERLRNTEEGIEQSWAFDSVPQGQGDLVVRVGLSGMAFIGSTSGGLHFGAEPGEPGLRYGVATWIDAQGRATRIVPTFDGAGITLVVPQSVLESSAYPAVLDPIVGPEIELDSPVFPEGSPGEQPGIAWDGTNFLACWGDDRDPAVTSLYCARFTPAGNVLDPSGIHVTPTAKHRTRPRVAFDGVNYLVVWEDYTFVQAAAGVDVRGARVTTAGAVLDPDGFVIAGTSNDELEPSVSFNGTNYLVAWTDYDGVERDVLAARVSPAGMVLDANPIVVCNLANSQMQTDMASDGTNFLVAWRDYRNSTFEAYTARIANDGTVLDPMGVKMNVASGGNEPGVAFGTNTYLVTWTDNSTIYARRVDPSTGQPQGSVITVAFISAGASRFSPKPAFYNGNYFIGWSESSNITGGTGQFIGSWVNESTGVVASPSKVSMLPGGAAVNGFEVIAHPGGFVGVACNTVVCKGVSFGDPNPGSFPSFVVNLVSNTESGVAVEYDGTRWLVAWTDSRGAHDGIFAVRVDAQGNVLDPSAIEVSNPINGRDFSEVALATNGSTFYLVWVESSLSIGTDIRGARLDGATGAVLDPTALTIETVGTLSTPRIAFDGVNYFAVWKSSLEIKGNQLSGVTGLPTKASAVTVTGSGTNGDPDIAFGAGVYLVAWERSTDARFTRVDTTGAVIDPAPTVLAANGTDVAVAFGAGEFLIGWDHGNIEATRVTPAGAVLDAVPLDLSTNVISASRCALSFDGSHFVAVLTEGLIGTQRVTWVAPDGSLANANPFTATTPETGFQADVASDGAGQTLLAYTRKLYEAPYGSLRAAASFISLTGWAGAPCAQATDCGSGFCVDGVCCDSACGNGDPTDCLVCSSALGGLLDGTCGPASSGTVCRAAVPGGCDLDEVCDGVGTGCPANVVAGAGVLCRASTGPCDPDDHCLGAVATCPPDVPLPDGTSCDDGSPCTLSDQCASGVCGGTPKLCPGPTDCHVVGGCDVQTGMCLNDVSPDGSPCDDGDACTQDDACQAGQCVGANPVVCPPADPCSSVAACDPATGTCAVLVLDDGSACDDGNLCTTGDLCGGGTCSGDPVACPAADECHDAGVCDPQDGSCSSVAQPDGSPCTGGTCEEGQCVPNGAGGGQASTTDTSSGTGTTGTETSGAGGTASAGGAGGAEADGGGCGCEVAGDQSPHGLWLAVLSLVLARARRARRRSLGTMDRAG